MAVIDKIIRLSDGIVTVVDLNSDTLKMNAPVVDGYARYNGATSGYVDIKAPASATSWTLTLPANNGDAGQFLQTDGDGNASWVTVQQTLAGLTDVQLSSLASGELVRYNGTKWVNVAPVSTASGTTVSDSTNSYGGNGTYSTLNFSAGSPLIGQLSPGDTVTVTGSGGGSLNLVVHSAGPGMSPLVVQLVDSTYMAGLSGSSRTLTKTTLTSGAIIKTNGSGRLDQTFLQYNINFNSNKLSGVAAPSAGTDATNKTYVDNAVSGVTSAKANTSLNNLTTTAINLSLIADTTATRDLGSSSIQWRDAYVSSSLKVATTGGVENIAASSTLNIGTAGNTSTLNLGTGTGTNTINIGTGSGATTINLGGAGDTVNIAGTLTYVNTTNLEVTDKLVVLNKGGAAASGDASGIAIEENGVLEGYAYVGNSRASWDFMAPANNGTFRLTPDASYIAAIDTAALSANRTYTLPNVSGTLMVGTAGILSLANGGTNANLTASNGSIVYSDADSLEMSSVGSSGQPLLSGGEGAPTWFSASGVVKASSGVLSTSAVSLTTEVSGVLPLANGGTNKNMTAVAGAVAYSSASDISLTAAGTAGQVLKSNGSSAPAFADPDKLYVTLSNSTGSAIAAGSVVALSQSDAGKIFLADADSLATCESVVGVVESEIANGSSGRVQIAGRCTVTQTAAFELGKRVYASGTAGSSTKTAPSALGSVIFVLGTAVSTTEVILNMRLEAVN